MRLILSTLLLTLLAFTALQLPGCGLECAWGEQCSRDGRCSLENGLCVATDESCKASTFCKQLQRCVARQGFCVPPCKEGHIVCNRSHTMKCTNNEWTVSVCPTTPCACYADCIRGEEKCTETTKKVCSSDGSAWIDTPCSSNPCQCRKP